MLIRRFVALVTSALLLTEILFPPFNPPRSYGRPDEYPVVYWFLFSPPCLREDRHCGTVSIELLALELAVTLAIGWLLIRFVAKE